MLSVVDIEMIEIDVDEKVTRKELTGRSSAASSVAVPNHKAGAVPKYLKVIGTNIVIDMLLMSLHMYVKKVVAIVNIVCDCDDADVSGEVGRDGDGKDACGVVCLQGRKEIGCLAFLKSQLKMSCIFEIAIEDVLQARQSEWREAEEKRIASIPVIVINATLVIIIVIITVVINIILTSMMKINANSKPPCRTPTAPRVTGC